MILLIDCGGQTAHLIARRIKDFGIEAQIVDPIDAYQKAKTIAPSGIIISGGPASVYEKNAPIVDKKLFSLGIPVLGICYGWQLMARLLGGNVLAGKKEYGPTALRITTYDSLFAAIPISSIVYESHGDTVEHAPNGFIVTATTETVKYAGVSNEKNKLYGVQFHPEVHHTKYGRQILKNFVTGICHLAIKPVRISVSTLIAEIQQKVKDKKVIGAFSGGTDSAVAGMLVAKAIGKQFYPVYIDSGLMREETLGRIQNLFPKLLGIPVRVIFARSEFLQALKGITDPEEKRKAIGRVYIELFEKEAKQDRNINFLLQGTTYADVIHSQGTKHSALIKSHHNVGGLPKNLQLQLIEPLRFYYTDQVRLIGNKLGLPKDVVSQQPFPGPGHAVRIIGEVTKERLEKHVHADNIVVEELKKFGWYNKVFQCWAISTSVNSTAVKGDGKFYGEVIAVRAVQSKDRMTANWAKLPYLLLEKLATRIVNEVPGVSRVVYDITTKPPATMEWE